MKKKLLYRSARVPSGRTAAALNLTPRALGWDRIHFAVRHLAARAVWTGLSRDQERCLVLLRGEFDVSWAGASHRIGPRAGRLQRVSVTPSICRRERRSGSSPGHPAKSPTRARHRGRPCSRASSVRKTAATRFAAAATRPVRSWTSCRRRFRRTGCSSARCSRPAATGRRIRRTSTIPTTRRARSISTRSTISATGIRTDTASSASIASGATTRCASRTATWSRSATAITRLLQPMATMRTT